MHPRDEEKTMFIIEEETYYYTRMFFGMKNARATYQRLVNKIFEHHIRWNMEVYIDDMMVKKKVSKDNFFDLKEVFTIIRGHEMRLNLKVYLEWR